MDKQGVEQALLDRGYEDFKWISGEEVEVAQWVRMKCMFGCKSYGQVATCPPATPSVAECREFFRDYSQVAVIHITGQFPQREDRKKWSLQTNLDLLELERDAFLLGHQKAFILFIDECQICAECSTTREECKNLDKARPGPEGMAMDVFATVRKTGYPIEVLTEQTQVMNRYAFLLVE